MWHFKSAIISLLPLVLSASLSFGADASKYYKFGPFGDWSYDLDSRHADLCLDLLSGMFPNNQSLKMNYFSYGSGAVFLGREGYISSPVTVSPLEPRIISVAVNQGRAFDPEILRGGETFAQVNDAHKELRRATLISAGATAKQIDDVEASETRIPRENISFLSISETGSNKPLGILRVVSLALRSTDIPDLPLTLYLKDNGFLSQESWNQILQKSYSHLPSFDHPVQVVELGMLYVDKEASTNLRSSIWQLAFNWLAKFQPAHLDRESAVLGHAIGQRTTNLYKSRRYGSMIEAYHFETVDAQGQLEYHSVLTKPTEEFIDATKSGNVTRDWPGRAKF